MELNKTDYFTEEWIAQWRSSIRKSDDYKKRAREWNAPILLKFDPVPEQLKERGKNGIFLDLQYGECHALHLGDQNDEVKSDIILTADEETWIRLIKEKKDPTMMIMKGKLKLEKGSLVLLSTHRAAAKSLLETAPLAETVGLLKPRDVEVNEQTPFWKMVKNRVSQTSKKETPVSISGNTTPVTRQHGGFVSTGKGLDFDSFPMQLFQKAKIYGIWNPATIDFTEDKKQWEGLSDKEKEILIHLSALFMAGEEAVTLDLLPLIMTLAKEGRIEEEIFLTSFLWEEAKHTEFFSRFINGVLSEKPDFQRFHKHFYRILFYEKLPRDLSRLEQDSSPLAQLKASGTYNMIVEGTLAETGYAAYYKMLEENDLLPGLREGITKLKQDESRHIAFGLYLINRLLVENPEYKTDFENHLEELLNDATNVIHEIFEPYDIVPFGLDKEWFLDYAIKQFQHRMNKLNLSST